MLEKHLQKQILDYLAYQKGIYFFRSASGAVSTDTGRFFRTGKKGCPDIVICKNGKFIGVEVKTSIGRQSEAQAIAQDEIRVAGGEYYIIRSLEDIKKIIDQDVAHR